jgi:hypothetical protein
MLESTTRSTSMTDRLCPVAIARVHDALAAHVEAGRMQGLVYLVAAGDDVHVEAIGRPAFDADRALRTDDLFRIASLTKPITAVAALTLVEEDTCGSTSPSTTSSRNWPTGKCCAGPTPSSTTPSPLAAPSPSTTC